ncbi:amidohydrolase family protein [Amphiplicatus metriothermophilus]|uniref:Dihydroorotase n=1 Tax=Amphiplicatus metriothermophilus TaxID=1519374 RepID=A0A239PVZ7_9PROT|nr:amidohydrolase family protein [Amphiplicatus metriothermophilus]MBB5518921.1 N-acyl-D-glutamate deacylase [Amphiplicatus metriothermophilus]SNT74479.1 dihydroorotase [Amphiplicatus metriothermophilus]
MKTFVALGLALATLLGLFPAASAEETFDLVILNGRVIDPETGLDAVRNVGVRGDRIARITKKNISGARVIDAEGFVVAPGFIDLHAHGQNIPSGRAQALDGVTTALELESGEYPVSSFYDAAAEEGRPIHYGASVNWSRARIAEITGQEPASHDDEFERDPNGPDWRYMVADETQSERILARVQQGLDEGGLGIGVLLGYSPGSGRGEYYALHELAATNGVPTFTHARYLSNTEPDSSFEGFQEMVAVSAATGAQMHVSHLNSISLRNIAPIRAMLQGAQGRGVNITVEAYPYGAGATAIGTALFEGGNWQARLGGIKKSDFTLDGTPLTDAEFDRLQKEAPRTDIVVHFLHPEDKPEDQAILDQSILYPGGAIASDGGEWQINGEEIASDVWPIPAHAESHPRSAGTFSKFLRVYVREQEAISLIDALAKTSLIPAQILEESVPQMRRKGRLQEGADADIVVFGIARVSDRATYEEPAQMSAGFEHVIVAGTPLVSNGVLDTSVLPGRPIRRTPRDGAQSP